MKSYTPPIWSGVRRLRAPILAILTSSFCLAQQAAPAPTTTKAATEDEEIILSPFVVQSSDQDIGYYTRNTLAGSRLNTSISDLASSITVVTKQQMADTASININDVFMYEAGTEGANTYTQTDVSRNGVPRDTIAGYSSDAGVPSTVTNANRVRGLGSPDSAVNNYPSISRIPFDSYNTGSVDISRGPNSLLFGTGSPAGIVNQSTSTAVLNKKEFKVEGRIGSWGSQRVTFSANIPLIKDKLALYVADLYDSVGYRRKPSMDITRRQYASLAFRPFKKTFLTASFEKFNNFNNRPNSQTPRDYVTPWVQAGRPAYDTTTRMITMLDTGVVKGPYVTDTRSPYTDGIAVGTRIPGFLVGNNALTQAPTSTVPNNLYIPGIAFGIGGSSRVLEITDRANIEYVTAVQGANFTTLPVALNAYSTDYVRPVATSLTPAQWMFSDRRLTSSTGPVAPTYGGYVIGGYVQPSVTNKAIYDWERINLLQMNYGKLEANITNIELQQEILPDLHFSAGYFKQILDAADNYTVSNANAITTLYVDTNVKNMDGTANKHFGNPFLLDISPDTFLRPETNENFRAMLSYQLDFSKRSGWTKWLGRHRMFGLWSKQDNEFDNLRYRYTWDGGDLRYQANPAAANAIIASSNISRIFYIGANDHGAVDYAPGRLGQPGYGGPDTMTVKTYNWRTSAWEESSLHASQQLFYASTQANIRSIASKSGTLNSYFWNDRIVTTFGIRDDAYRARTTNFTNITTADQYTAGIAKDPEWIRQRLTDWYRLQGRTKTSGVVVKLLRYKGAELSVHYNKSDNFNPPAGIPVDFFGTPLPKSTGTGKDYGVGLSMFDNKLVARVNWYESNNLNAPATAATTAIGRVSRGDTSNFRSWAEYVVRLRHGEGGMTTDPTTGVMRLTDTNFANNTTHPLTVDEQNEIATLMHIPQFNNWPPPGIGGTQTNSSKGMEFEVIYNPISNWNIKATASKITAIYQDVAPQIDAYMGDGTTDGRLKTWMTATAPDMPAEFLLAAPASTPISLRNFWTGYGFNADARLSNATGSTPTWTSPKGFYESAILSEINVAKALQGKAVPNARPWSFSVISNYKFTQPKLKGFSLGGGYRWADRAIAGFYGDTTKRDSANVIMAPDLTRPIMTPSQGHLDVWMSYTRKMFKNSTQMKIQFNVRDALEGGKLQPIAYNFDGSPFAYRIIDSRQYFMTTTFTF